ncbi:hypothetical protein [Paenibacillus sp. FSL R5-0345]|uniref:hypothetical protein n=1 Tax=Paenibacillus sp. FSL R5-0345 TaxID=1536770 RepID=UPI000ACD8399|nr:hypothetical protein [Paenibacillus sp. FSL R5-0345]
MAHIKQLEIIQLPSREQAERDHLELRVMNGGSPLMEGESLADRMLERGLGGTAPYIELDKITESCKK